MPTTRRIRAATAIAAIAAATALSTSGRAAQDSPAKGLGGTWKLVVLAFGEDEFAAVKLDPAEGKPSGKVVAAQSRIFGSTSDLKAEPVAIDGDSVTVGIKGPAGQNVFKGKLVKDGPDAGRVLGTFTFRGEAYPARLERTTSDAVAEMKQSPMVQSYLGIMRERDPKAKVAKLQELLDKNAGKPSTHLVYAELLGAAEAGGLGAAEVAAIVDRWAKEAEPYGEGWASGVRLKALKALSAGKAYGELATKLAQQAEQGLAADAKVEDRASIAGMLARAARLAGKADIAADAEARSARLEAQLDEEYHKKVPPFTPAKYEGRKKPRADRVVLMELFTGAECPPCVAADVGFDALLKSYGPRELIGLQYHLHIPGPDPMTNIASQGRQEYYGDQIRGTPSTFFNGQSNAGGGGPMQFAENKYNEFRQIIDPLLETDRDAGIELSARRNGDVIEIQARATVDRKTPLAKGSSSDDDAEGDEKKPKEAPHSKPRLRLALTEESVRYVGRNGLRFHHHVVRAFPGGVEGKDLSSGSGQVMLTLKLDELRQELRKKNEEDARSRIFRTAPPEIPLKDLSVVAFVQDDGDKAILHAVSVPVE